MLTDMEIALGCNMKKIGEIAAGLGLTEEDLELYGPYKAKVTDRAMKRLESVPDGKLVLVTAINPTPAGEGKTTTTVALGQAMAKIGKKAVIALREPSLGPVFGIKGGAAGGGYAQVVPMEDINLHFTGDFHAITSANNLLCAAIDNHLQQGNALRIDPKTILFKRVMDMNDRALRSVVVGLGGRLDGVTRPDGFMITVASEIMAILCLADNLSDLKARLGRILIGYNYDRQPVFARDIGVCGAMAALLKDAVKPNLVQTLENTPAIMHGGPFANIAHGCNSVRATRLGLKLADYCITEAGFGSDLGAEKFFDIKCRAAGLTPSAVVLVATVRALKYNGGVDKAELKKENVQAVQAGLCNLGAHIDNLKHYGVPIVVTLNHFYADTDAEIALVEQYCKDAGVDFAVHKGFEKGGEGAVELAEVLCRALERPGNFTTLYPDDMPVKQKIETVAREVYGADGVDFTPAAQRALAGLAALSADKLPVCMAKTQYSLSDDPKKLGRPQGFRITVKEIRPSLGAGFVVALTGDIMTMPGLPKDPAANHIDIDDDGVITGLF